MNVKLSALSAGVLFFLGQSAFAQTTQDTTSRQEIEEVVVIGYVKKPIGQVTGSASSLSADEIDTPSAIDVTQALQGKVPGAVINASSGTPGAMQDIRIRGVGTFMASNDPLYVIDGVPVVSGNTGSSSAVSSLSALASINNNDIESIYVLKDAASTAIYGARGSNGVVVINTKSGKRGKTKFNFSTSLGFQNEAYNKVEMLSADQRLELLTESIANLGYTTEQAKDLIVANDFGSYSLWDGQNHNWMELTRRENAPIYVANFSASGGDQKSKFYASLGYNKTEPISIADNFKRITGAFNYSRKLSKKLNFKTSIHGSWVKQNPILEGGTYFGNPYVSRYLLSPWVNPYNPDGSYNIDDFSKMTSLQNTLYTQANNIVWNHQMRGLVNTSVDYEIIDNLTFTTHLNIDYLFSDYKEFYNRHHGDGKDVNGSSRRYHNANFNLATINQLNYVGKWGRHRLDVSAFFEYIKNQRDWLEGYGENIPTDGLSNLDSTSASFDVSSGYQDWKNASYFGVLNYSYAGKYVLDATIRREGSSRFAPGNRFGTFWSVGAAWNASREDFIPDFFSDLKLRASYGLTGNSGVGLNQYQAILAYDAAYDSNGGSYVSNFGSPDLTWEKNRTIDVGLNFGVWDGRISGTVDYYHKETFDLLQNVPLSLTTGFTSVLRNSGSMLNEGVEASLNVGIIRSKNVKWDVFASVATVHNEILELAKSVDGKPIDIYAGSSYRKAIEGKPFMGWFMRTWAGVNPETGAPEWYVNGVSGERTSNYNQAARVYQGSAIPKYTGGFGTNFSFKNIFLNASFYYAGGHKIYDQYAQFYYRTNSFTLATYNGRAELMERWQKPGDITDIPKLSFNTNNNFDATSSRHLYDGDFIRLKNVSLGYSVPRKYVESIGITGLTLSVTGTNLWTYTFDRDVTIDPETASSGYTELTTPPVKSVLFGVDVQF